MASVSVKIHITARGMVGGGGGGRGMNSDFLIRCQCSGEGRAQDEQACRRPGENISLTYLELLNV